MLKRKVKSFFLLLKKITSQRIFIYYKGLKKVDLLIFDTIYPHPVSGFRFEEFTVLLTAFRDSKIIMSTAGYPILKTPVTEHKKHIAHLLQLNKPLRSKLKINKGFININASLFYCLFAGNIFVNLKWLDKYKIPFIFTLYPGGGFKVDDGISDMQLEKIFASPMFKKVFVTQLYTRDYLINKNFCKPENIEYIFGGVVPQNSLIKDLTDKRSYLINKTTFDICFCAAKYTPRGEDKGYDVFIDFARQIATKYDFIRFHIIGGFTENDLDITMIKDKIHFYGYQKFEALETIYKSMDVLVSPNKPFVLSKGAFDGFPLGTVVEAVLNGVVGIISDALNQNNIFIPNEELIIIESNSKSIEKEIIDLINQPEKLYFISEKGREKFVKVFSNEIQMEPRIELIRKEIKKIKNDKRYKNVLPTTGRIPKSN